MNYQINNKKIECNSTLKAFIRGEQITEESLKKLLSCNYQSYINISARPVSLVGFCLAANHLNAFKKLYNDNKLTALFLTAVKYGNIEALEWLAAKAPDKLQNLIAVKNYYAFRIAATNGHISALKWLAKKAPDKLQDMINAGNHYAFYSAAKNGHLDILKWFAEKTLNKSQIIIAKFDRKFTRTLHRNVLQRYAPKASTKLRNMIAESNYYVFRFAANNGHRDVLKWFAEKTPDKLQHMIASQYYEAFDSAAKNGHLEVLQWFAEKAPDKLRHMIDKNSHSAFRLAAENGQLDVLKWLTKQAPDKLRSMIASKDYDAFIYAAKNGHLNVLKWLAEKAPSKLHRMINEGTYLVFGLAAENGYLNVLKWLAEKAPDKLQDMIAANDHYAFRYAAGSKLNVLKWLAGKAPDKLQDMIAANDHYAFRLAAEQGQLDILKWLAETAPEKLQDMISAHGYYAFIFCPSYDARTYLLACDNPQQFAYIEQHDVEYGAKFVYPYVTKKLNTLIESMTAFEQQSPNGIFDIEEKDAKLWFYILRNLIRRNDDALQIHISRLTAIPSIRNLLHQNINNKGENELLRLAQSLGNIDATNALLSIPAVRALAQAADYYQDELQAHGMGLRHMVRNCESSMLNLNQAEQKIINGVKTRYKQTISQQGGENKIFENFRDALKNRYEKSPAKITLGSDAIILPLKWKKFQQLLIQHKDNQKFKEQAIQAYFQHDIHTAYRYVSKPNHWMHKNASFVYINNSRNERWSTFEEFIPLIAYFYTAANDKKYDGTEGVSTEERINLFIKQIALIGRAHNWDNTNSEGAEYDDLEGDKPSCYSGVKRRLFQSVMHCPLFNALTTEKLKAEVRDRVRTQIKEQLIMLSPDDIKKLQTEINAVFELETAGPLLRKITINECDILNGIKEKYPLSFVSKKTYPVLPFRINLKENETHIMNLYLQCGLEQLIKQIGDQKAENGSTQNTLPPLSIFNQSSKDSTNQKKADVQSPQNSLGKT